MSQTTPTSTTPTSSSMTTTNPKSHHIKPFSILVVRHGERLDYVQRDSGSNWLHPSSNDTSNSNFNSNSNPKSNAELVHRPWDPPLTSHGHTQARLLGQYIQQHLYSEYKIGKVTAVYSSPMIRCCQTAAEMIVGMNMNTNIDMNMNTSMNMEGDEPDSSNLKVKVEPGLIESLNEDWYRSWCFPNSDGTWGGIKSDANNESTLDPRATLPAQTLIATPHEIVKYMAHYEELDKVGVDKADSTSDEDTRTATSEASASNTTSTPSSIHDLIDTNYINPNIHYQYTWNNFEQRSQQQDRMEQIVQTLYDKHMQSHSQHGAGKEPETVVLVSHGGPVTHLFERLSGMHWSKHGVSTYTSFSLYQPRSGTIEGAIGCEEEGQKEDEEVKVEGPVWEPLLVNESCHLQQE